jgi:putative transposase
MLRKSQAKLTRTSQKKNAKKRGSKARRKLAKREGRQHQKIARSRKDFQYKTAHQLEVNRDRRLQEPKLCQVQCHKDF